MAACAKPLLDLATNQKSVTWSIKTSVLNLVHEFAVDTLDHCIWLSCRFQTYYDTDKMGSRSLTRLIFNAVLDIHTLTPALALRVDLSLPSWQTNSCDCDVMVVM